MRRILNYDELLEIVVRILVMPNYGHILIYVELLGNIGNGNNE